MQIKIIFQKEYRKSIFISNTIKDNHILRALHYILSKNYPKNAKVELLILTAQLPH